MTNSEHLQWIHDRITNFYGESENTDYLIRLREIIAEQKELEVGFKNYVNYINNRENKKKYVSDVAMNLKNADTGLSEDDIEAYRPKYEAQQKQIKDVQEAVMQSGLPVIIKNKPVRDKTIDENLWDIKVFWEIPYEKQSEGFDTVEQCFADCLNYINNHRNNK